MPGDLGDRAERHRVADHRRAVGVDRGADRLGGVMEDRNVPVVVLDGPGVGEQQALQDRRVEVSPRG